MFSNFTDYINDSNTCDETCNTKEPGAGVLRSAGGGGAGGIL